MTPSDLLPTGFRRTTVDSRPGSEPVGGRLGDGDEPNGDGGERTTERRHHARFDVPMDGPAAAADETNRLAPYAPAILAVKWATTGVSIALASLDVLAANATVIAWVCVIAANTVYRTIRPLAFTGSSRSIAVLSAEIVMYVVAVITTGYWNSPLVLLLINTVIVAGFAGGFGFALRVGVVSALAVTGIGWRAGPWDAEQVALAIQWTTLLISAGAIAGYTRRISGEANRRHSLALDRMARLADANSLLTHLHRVAQTLPASLDLGEVLDSSLTRLRSLVDHDASFILTREETDGSWSVASQRGLGISGQLPADRLPRPVHQAVTSRRLVTLAEVAGAERAIGPSSNDGLYLPLLARGRLIGVLGIESRDDGVFTERDAQVLRGFIEPAALAIDNALWFDRIRTVAADEERTRIARDLHDRIGQALAYLGFEIDRLIRHQETGQIAANDLYKLRDDLGDVIGEVRDTLSDLRTDVTDASDFAETAHGFAAKVAERSGLEITLDCDTEPRLPILQEREMWRIAQEALVNVERHAQASTASIVWRCQAEGTLLEVADDGQGLPERNDDGSLGRSDSYGIVGMRERADSVGATLELISKPGEGTKVRCFLPKT